MPAPLGSLLGAWLLTGALGPATAEPQAQEAAPPADPRPKFSLLQQTEDWSRIGQLDPDELDWTDRLKWMPVDDAGHWRINLGGTARVRVENWSNFGFEDPVDARTDDVFPLARIRLHADLHHDRGFRSFLELKSAAAWDRELPGGDRPNDEDQLALLQGFVQQRFDTSMGDALTLTAGRQMLMYGAGRLIGPAPWANTLRSWDGATASLDRGPWVIDAFWQRFAPVNITSFNDSVDDEMLGIYASRKDVRGVVELYAFIQDRGPVSFNGTIGDERRDTFGVRVGRGQEVGRMDYDLEFALQRGEVGAEDVNAWMLGFDLGYVFEAPSQPRAKFGLEIGSGDSGAGGEVGTFSPAYPLGHRYFGFIDSIGRSNTIDIQLGAGCALSSSTRADLTLHRFLREDNADDVYQVSGAPYAGTAVASGSSSVGTEVDLVVSGRVGRNWSWQLGWSHFVPDMALEAAGFDESSDLVYTTVVYAF